MSNQYGYTFFALPDGERYWLPDLQNYAVEQERQRHTDSIYHYGEYAVIALMWKTEDFAAGLVDRCPTCYTAYGKVADAYGQPSKRRCPDCFGTTFEGGFKARIVRPTMWNIEATQYGDERSGSTETTRATIQATPDFKFRTGDYVIRANGTRWQVAMLSNELLVTGFGTGTDERMSIGYNVAQATEENNSSVAYDILPDTDTANTILQPVSNHPVDFSAWEIIRGPLL